jgi:hypothetical protein
MATHQDHEREQREREAREKAEAKAEKAEAREANDKEQKTDQALREERESAERQERAERTTSQTSTATTRTSENGPKAPQAQQPPSGNKPTSESHPTQGHPTFPNQPKAATTSGEPIAKPNEKLDPKSGDMLVDPRPTAPPIVQGNAEYVFPPAAASSDEVLAIEPNLYEDAVDGPDEQISQITYVHWTRPDGGDFIAPLSTAEVYERKGFKRGEDEDIPDLVAYMAENAKSDEQRERDKVSKERIEQHDRDRRELLTQQQNRRREQARAG